MKKWQKSCLLLLTFSFALGWIAQGEATLIRIDGSRVVIPRAQLLKVVIVDSNGNAFEQMAHYDPFTGILDIDTSWAGPNASIYIPALSIGYIWYNGYWVDQEGYYWKGTQRVYVSDPHWKERWGAYWRDYQRGDGVRGWRREGWRESDKGEDWREGWRNRKEDWRESDKGKKWRDRMQDWRESDKGEMWRDRMEGRRSADRGQGRRDRTEAWQGTDQDTIQRSGSASWQGNNQGASPYSGGTGWQGVSRGPGQFQSGRADNQANFQRNSPGNMRSGSNQGRQAGGSMSGDSHRGR